MSSDSLSHADPDLSRAVTALRDVLLRERAAIARLDSGALEGLAEQKRTAADELRGVVRPDAPAWVRAALSGLRAEAEANRALLDDAIAAIAEARGLYRDSGTYDARARRRTTFIARYGKGI